jgi:hypothetical protein
VDFRARGAGEGRRQQADASAEGFPAMTPAEFVAFFCRTHRGCNPEDMVTRIEWRYLSAEAEY